MGTHVLRKQKFTALFLVLITLLIVGCRKTAPEVSVLLEIKDVIVEGKKVKVSGSTNLPDGASLVYELTPLNTGEETWLLAGDTSVEDQAWFLEEKLPSSLVEKLELWISFMPLTSELDEGRNSKEIYEIYGEGGVNIALDENVETFGKGKDVAKRVVAIIIIDFRNEEWAGLKPES